MWALNLPRLQLASCGVPALPKLKQTCQPYRLPCSGGKRLTKNFILAWFNSFCKQLQKRKEFLLFPSKASPSALALFPPGDANGASLLCCNSSAWPGASCPLGCPSYAFSPNLITLEPKAELIPSPKPWEHRPTSPQGTLVMQPSVAACPSGLLLLEHTTQVTVPVHVP